MAIEFTKVKEQSRIYHYPGGDTFQVNHVCKFACPNGRTHRLETVDGRKWIVADGWVAIELVMSEWTL